MKIAIVYVYSTEYDPSMGLAGRFLQSMGEHPPGEDHELIVVCNQPVDLAATDFFAGRASRFIEHDDSGWDIGAFLKASKLIECDMMVCMGGAAHVRRAGWLSRFVHAWNEYGPGFYGSLSNFERATHLITSGFCCPPSLLRAYPQAVVTFGDRCEFEHGGHSIWKLAGKMNLPVKLITWDGEYDQKDWRTPPNIYRRGDQSNCLTFHKGTEIYETSNPEYQELLRAWADTPQ